MMGVPKVRALVLYSREGRVPGLAQALAQELGTHGYQVQLMEAEEKGTGPITCGVYDLVVAGSPVKGIFGGKVATDIELSLRRCSRLEGKTSAAFVQPGIFGSAKALRLLMGQLERHGAIVRDFATLSSDSEVRSFAERLVALRNP